MKGIHIARSLAFLTSLSSNRILSKQRVSMVSSAASAASASSSSTTNGEKEYYRSDGVRITHDPYEAGFIEKYGEPGETDKEGFDPYEDSVGAGIYGGIVKRDTNGNILIGKQFQNHNEKPGPVYAGGGYAPIIQALSSKNKVVVDNTALIKLLQKYPDLVNDITTGGAQPLHACGMSNANQYATETIISNGGDIEALDTYGMTPLHRMASNNLPIGAQMLLEAGADPYNKGLIGVTPADIAKDSHAIHVRKVLLSANRLNVFPKHIMVDFINNNENELTFVKDLTGRYNAMKPAVIPKSFEKVCKEQDWNTLQMWKQLNNENVWYQHTSNNSYVYYNQLDHKWWMDDVDGLGMYTNENGVSHTIPAHGWIPLTKVKGIILPMVRCFRS